MRRLWRFFIPALVIVVMIGGGPARASTQDFTIASFNADYYLTRDAQKVPEMRVDETIVAQFPSFDQNHGILRAIPESYQHHGLELRVNSVKDQNDKAWHYSTSEENGNLVLKIGDADTYVHGDQTYKIDYSLRGVIMDTAHGQEFYWDVNGDQWPQVFRHVSAQLHIDADIVSALQDPSRCYTGSFGSQASLCTINYSYDQGKGRIISVATGQGIELQPNETLSMELGFAKGTFAPYTLSAREIGNILTRVAAVAAVPLLTLFILLRNYLRSGRDPKGRGVIVPEYLPPKDVSVLGSSAVLNEGYMSKAASATIIDLAVRHYLKIYEVEKKGLFKSGADYEIELVKAPADLGPDEQGVIDMLFGAVATVGDKVNLDTLKTKLATKSQQLGKDVEERMASGGYFTKAPSKAKAPYYGVGVVMLIAAFIMFGLGTWLTFLAIGLGIAGLMAFIGAVAMPARTTKGVELREYLKGLEDYIKLAEADRLKALQSPRGDLTEKINVDDHKQLVKLYERLLPYAMLFNLEKEWAKVMAPLYNEQPDWYAGNSAFNAVWFASSLSGFTTAAGTAFSPPSSSGSGGGAGGGGGGGGGGGW
jgi:hypothetical protein